MRLTDSLPRVAILLGLAAIFALAGCGTKKNTASRRFYHRTTSYFNYYFNARDAYRMGERMAMENVRYDFTRPLPFSLAGLPEASVETGGEMDRAIEKCAELIRYHSITAKPTRGKQELSASEKAFYSQNEFNPYARKAWLLIGKARIWSNELDQAQQALDFSMRQFAQQPEGWEAELWMARIESLRGDTLSARHRLQALSASTKRSKGKATDLQLASFWADLYCQQSRYEAALPYARQALRLAKRSAERARMRVALAQIYEAMGRSKEAFDLYHRVAGSSSNYELRFNARVKSLSLAARVEGKGMERTLRKMADDDKNTEYLDQIYYALGQIAETKGDTLQAIDFYKESAARSVSNSKQKGISFLQVGDYYYRHADYLGAQAFYDSAASVLPEGYPGFEAIASKARGLTKLAMALRNVNHEDSVQRVAKMPESERMTLIKERIAKLAEEERQAKLAEEQERRDRDFAMMNQYRNANQEATTSGQGWYFYNAGTLSFGRSDFRLKWGDRKLEDNWRRKNKSAVLLANSEDGANSSDSTAQKKVDKTSVEYYLKGLPLNDSLMQLSDGRIVLYLMEAAEAYNHEVNDPARAAESYASVAQRFPRKDEAAQGLYLAYITARQGNLEPQAAQYRETLLSKYPSSSYAQMVTDPSYASRLREQVEQLESLHKSALDTLMAGHRAEAYRIAQEGASLAAKSDYEPRFALLLALSTGDEPGNMASIQALKQLTRQHAGTEQSEYAAEILRAIDRRALAGNDDGFVKLPTGRADTTAVADQKSYKRSDGEHWLAVLVPSSGNLNEITFRVLGLTVDYNVDLNLDVSHEPIDGGLEAIMVRTFEDWKAAEAFRRALVKADLFEGRKPVTLIISPANFAILKEEKTVVPYLQFYESSYTAQRAEP